MVEHGPPLLIGGSGPPRIEFNWAILVLDNPREFRNWSKWSTAWKDEVVNRFVYNEPGRAYLQPPVTCTLEPHFWKTLKWFWMSSDA